jgi:hypothetical protein
MAEGRREGFWTWFGRLADFWSVTEPIHNLMLALLATGGLMTPLLNWLGIPWWQAAVIGFCVIAALGVTAYFAGRIGHMLTLPQERASFPSPLPPPSMSKITDYAWLIEIAENDLREDIGVIVVRQHANLYTPNISDPYIEFFWTVFNGSVWEVEIEARPTGHIFLYEGPLGWHPDYKRNMLLLKPQYETLSFPYSGGKRTIAHADGLDIQLLYWLSPADITTFKERISSNKGLDIAFNDFNMWAIKGPEGNKRRFRINLPMETLSMPGPTKEEEEKT